MRVLQTLALPLGYVAFGELHRLRGGLRWRIEARNLPSDSKEQVENWSGKRDLNPRPQPWQGCALPLSYSRSRLRRILRGWEAVKASPLYPTSKALRNNV